MLKDNDWRIYLLVAFIGLLFFVPYLGSVHLFDWDEINFAEAAREMINTGDYMTVRIDYQPFHEKPPIFLWMQAASMKVFGVNEFGARFPNALIGIISLLFIYHIGCKLFDYKFGILWVLAYIGSFLPHFYFKSGIIDPTFNLFIFAGIYFLSKFFFKYTEDLSFRSSPKYRDVAIAGLFIGLAVLTKGPVGYLMPFITFCVWYFFKRKIFRFPFKPFLLFTLIAAIPAICWYATVLSYSGWGIFGQFISYQIRLLTTEDAGHGGPIYYHFIILLIGCFPASVLMLRGLFKRTNDTAEQSAFRMWALILLGTVLVVFSLVETKIIHYSSLAYFPLTFLAAYAMYHISYRELSWKKSSSWLLGILGIIWAGLFLALPLLLMNVRAILPRIMDKFTAALLRTNVHWGGYEYMIGVIYLLAIIVSIILISRKRFIQGFVTLFGATSIVMFTFLPIIAPKIEPYTQGAPIEFYKSMEGKDCYIDVLGFKSYAHYFYSKRPQSLSSYSKGMDKTQFEKWLLEGNVDKPVYFVTKNIKMEGYTKMPGLQVLYEKNGFVFMKRVK